MTTSIQSFWSVFQDGGNELLHPSDRAHFQQRAEPGADGWVHTNLVPAPYQGSLGTADIFVVLLSPGIDEQDAMAEADPAFRARRLADISQRLSPDYPLSFFDPALAWHPGHAWMRRTFGGLMGRRLAHRLAVLEAFPYHTQGSPPTELMRSLPSVTAMRNYVQALALRARHGEILLIIARAAAHMGLQRIEAAADNLIVYERGEARGAYLTPATRGGKAIAAWMNDRAAAGCGVGSVDLAASA